MKEKLFCAALGIAFLCLSGINAIAQDYFQIHGKIKIKEAKKPLKNAVLHIVGSNIYGMTNDRGKFSIDYIPRKINNGSVRIMHPEFLDTIVSLTFFTPRDHQQNQTCLFISKPGPEVIKQKIRGQIQALKILQKLNKQNIYIEQIDDYNYKDSVFVGDFTYLSAFTNDTIEYYSGSKHLGSFLEFDKIHPCDTLRVQKNYRKGKFAIPTYIPGIPGDSIYYPDCFGNYTFNIWYPNLYQGLEYPVSAAKEIKKYFTEKIKSDSAIFGNDQTIIRIYPYKNKKYRNYFTTVFINENYTQIRIEKHLIRNKKNKDKAFVGLKPSKPHPSADPLATIFIGLFDDHVDPVNIKYQKIDKSFIVTYERISPTGYQVSNYKQHLRNMITDKIVRGSMKPYTVEIEWFNFTIQQNDSSYYDIRTEKNIARDRIQWYQKRKEKYDRLLIKGIKKIERKL